MLMKPGMYVLGAAMVGMVALSDTRAITIVVPDIDASAENLVVDSPGAVTAYSISYNNHVVGPTYIGVTPLWDRPIVQFPISNFASLTGQSVVSATLHYSIFSDFTEPGESATSEVRLFTTSETELNLSNRNILAGLSGDGGAHTIVGSVSFVDGMTGAQSLAFSPAALTALENAINGSDPTLAISFREFAVSGGITREDLLDEFVLGVPPGNMTIEITAVPEPVTPGLLLCGSAAAMRGRRRNRSGSR